jgi:hypothetical protein
MIGITATSVIAGILIYAISQRTRRGKSDVQLLSDTPASVSAGGGGT